MFIGNEPPPQKPTKELSEKALDAALRVVFGPETSGVIVASKLDKNNPSLRHILVETPEGERRQFSFSVDQIERRFRDGIRLEKDKKTYEVGEEISIQTWGTGMLHLPWSKAERDPFDLHRGGKER